jgi:mono/diheme cytochrome c family protein
VKLHPIVLLAAIALALPAPAAEIARGQALYDARCGGCHTESVHGRLKRQATDFDAVRGWVVRWNTNLKLQWDRDQVDDVAAYLNLTYYKFACPPSICKVAS